MVDEFEMSSRQETVIQVPRIHDENILGNGSLKALEGRSHENAMRKFSSLENLPR